MKIIKYCLNFPGLDIKHKRASEQLYHVHLLMRITNEIAQYRCIPTKIYKPTKIGTRVKFEAIGSVEYINAYIKETNGKFNLKIPELEGDCL